MPENNDNTPVTPAADTHSRSRFFFNHKYANSTTTITRRQLASKLGYAGVIEMVNDRPYLAERIHDAMDKECVANLLGFPDPATMEKELGYFWPTDASLDPVATKSPHWQPIERTTEMTVTHAISRRDLFAGQAMAGMVGHLGHSEMFMIFTQIVEEAGESVVNLQTRKAVEYADALIAELDRTAGGGAA